MQQRMNLRMPATSCRKMLQNALCSGSRRFWMPTRRTDNEFVAVVAGLTPWPLSIFDGGGEEVLAHGSWGASGQIRAKWGAFAPDFFGFFLFYCRWVFYANGRGR